MQRKPKKSSWLLGVASAALCLNALPATAQEAQTPDAIQGPQQTPNQQDTDTITSAESIVVTAEIAYRNRSEETAPVLEYGLDYFQRFEPLTVGDALKRVPSVTFLSDVLESDGVRLRGLDPAYTQILINGDKVPGSGSDSGAFGNGADGAFFVDRIPAELIERIELVRSASANRSGDAMAGAVNIVLRDGYSLEGGYVRLGALGFDDGRIRETYGAVWGGEVGGGRLLLGANVQGRRNPKEKLSLRYTAPGGALVNIEDQTDVRDGTDYSGNFAYEVEVGPGELSFDGFYVKTERKADEDSYEFLTLPAPPATPTTFSALARVNNNFFTLNDNDVDTEQDSWSLNGGYELEAFGGETRFKLGYAKFDQSEDEFENEVEYLRGGEITANPPANRQYPEADRFTRDLIRADVDDTETKAKIEHTRDIGFGDLEFGLHYEGKERDNFSGEGRFRVTFTPTTVAGPSLPDASGAGLTIVEPAIVANAGGDNTIERTQIAPYVMLAGESGAFDWEAGLRYEQTEIDIEDRTLTGPQSSTSSDYGVVLPSAHLRWSVTEADRVHVSVARTIRNPSFNFLSPAALTAELGDNDFRGNPNLEPEMAWGGDVGYERQIGKDGIIGVNVFYRAVEDLIEIANTGERGSVCAPLPAACLARVFEPRNTGDGNVYGVEFDASFPLSFIGLPDTGVFANYSWLDSEIDDDFGSRRFNSQSDYIYNFGFIHDFVVWDAAFGATYRKQGDAFSRVIGEEVTTSYEGVLEVFVEKSFGERFTIRLTGSNLTDGSKDEVFDKFSTFANQVARSYTGGEYEIETETAGPVWQLIGRYAF
ncbi:MAG: TonB-dependent receptor [Hyphomonadaceae bacterium]|nr:TonB-dependent receptor [Hyphomonadaceae bacterium]